MSARSACSRSTAGKVVLVDLGELDWLYRIVSVILLAAVLLCASVRYARARGAERA